MDEIRDAAQTLHEVLIAEKFTVAAAESLTGGQVAAALTSLPGSSAYFQGGVVSYAASVKRNLLGVSEEVLAEHGTVSAACAEQMAIGVRHLIGAQFAVSTTGIAGPDTSEGQPVGTVFVGVATSTHCWSRRWDLGSGSRQSVQAAATLAALRMLHDAVGGL